MIAFISQYPDTKNEKDGMIQRIARIDTAFRNKRRVYIYISFRKNWIKRKTNFNDLLSCEKVNFFMHFKYILKICMKSDCVYIHSIYNSLKVFFIYFIHEKIITDMHGVVCEELKMENKFIKLYFYKIIENIVMKKSKHIICVTEKMVNYFLSSYNCSKDKFYVIPIFDENRYANFDNKSIEPYVIYAGGTQKWQCIDEMMRIIKKSKLKKFILFSQDIKTLKKKIDKYNLNDKIFLDSIPKKDIYKYYEKANFGFILRENSIVNRVACPTKLIEYMQCGVIPIVMQKNIGDFFSKGYSCILVDEFLNRSLDKEEMKFMRNNNLSIVNEIKENAKKNLEKLVKIL